MPPTKTRRIFLKTTAAASAGFAVPTIVPSSVLGLDGKVPPSERILLGGIGIWHRGSYVLSTMMVQPDVRVVAVSDVRSDRRLAVKAVADRHNGDNQCAMYRDFRELLSRSDIDAVLIATGDRWHAHAAMLAANAGKDVYCEKPCAISIALTQALADTVRRTGCVFQAGTQRRNISNFAHAVRLAQSGKLGNLQTLYAHISGLEDNQNWLPAQPEPDPEEIDWNLWLGPAPWRPFNQAYVDREWRKHYDFSAGYRLLGLGSHTVDLCQWANNADGTTPIEYTVHGNEIVCRYANGVKLIMRSSGWLGLGGCPVRFEGDEGWVETGDSGRMAVSLDSLRANLPAPALYGTAPEMHVRDFFDCVKSRAKPATNEEIMRKSHIACHAAALAWKLGRKLTLDPVTEEFVDDDEANRMRSRIAREPWII